MSYPVTDYHRTLINEYTDGINSALAAQAARGLQATIDAVYTIVKRTAHTDYLNPELKACGLRARTVFRALTGELPYWV